MVQATDAARQRGSRALLREQLVPFPGGCADLDEPPKFGAIRRLTVPKDDTLRYRWNPRLGSVVAEGVDELGL